MKNGSENDDCSVVVSEDLSNRPLPKILTPRETAAVLRCSVKALNALARAGRIGYVWKNERERAYYPKHINEYLQAREVKACVHSAEVAKAIREPQRSTSNKPVDNVKPDPSLSTVKGGEEKTARESERGKSFRAQLRKEMCSWQ